MSDESQLKSLLTLAARMPDEVQAPLPGLVRRARRRRARRMTASAMAAAVAIVLAVGVPALIGTLGVGGPRPSSTAPGGLFPAHPISSPPGPTASQIARFRWSALPSSPLGARRSPILAWTGSELIELGGPGASGTSSLSAAAYAPATGRWHPIASLPGSVGSTAWSKNYGLQAVTVWTGRELFVASSGPAAPAAAALRGPAALYDPATNHWTVVRLPRAVSDADSLSATWTGRMIVLSAVRSGRVYVAFYDPATGRWTSDSPVLPADHTARFTALITAGHRIIMWSWWDRTHAQGGGYSIASGTDVLTLGAGSDWHVVTDGWPQHQSFAGQPTTAGSRILIPFSQIWCGLSCSPPYASRSAYFADPATLRRTPILAGPLGEAAPALIWTGRTIIAVNTGAQIGNKIRPGDTALYDPAANRWQRLATAPGRPLFVATPLWTGSQLLALTPGGELLGFGG